jgi:hypothetical protein
MDNGRQSEAFIEMESEIEKVIEVFVALAGVAAVKSLLGMIARQSIAAADHHEGLAWVSGVVQGAAQFVDKNSQG